LRIVNPAGMCRVATSAFLVKSSFHLRKLESECALTCCG
jgi:hypothetical protein